jgi:hypothetical protein
MGDQETMMAALQQFSQRQRPGQPGANVPPALPPMQGGQEQRLRPGQMPQTGGGEPMMQSPMTGGGEPIPQQAAQGASVPAQQGPLQAQTVLQALNAGAQPRATGRGYGYRK